MTREGGRELTRLLFRWFMRRRKALLMVSRYVDRDPHKAIGGSRCPRTVPRLLWSYWKQGEDAAPDLVKHCIDSWRILNPGWDVRILDPTSVPHFTPMDGVPESMRVQHYADVLRLRLLDEYGGVWVDATTRCAKPLDHWLPPLMQSGFFAFSRPGPDREIASWFLASEPGGTLIRAWRRAADAYWLGVSRADNYYWLHYLFEWVTLKNREAGGLWVDTPHISADAPLHVQRCLRLGYDATRIRDSTGLEAIPIHKLNWRENTSIDDLQRILRNGEPLRLRRSGRRYADAGPRIAVG
jgi:hypothetical protein